MENSKIQRRKGVLIAGTHSGAGKTTVTLAILEALTRRGFSIQAFKAGPDYLDPTFHEIATGRPSRNLDGWMMGRENVLRSFRQNTQDVDFSVIEGVMGLYDGLRGRSEEGSSAQIAQWLSVPVILVLDAKGLARTAASVVSGCQKFDPGIQIQGVIFNRIGSKNHLEILKESVESYCKVKVLGGIPLDASMTIPERHLGLVQAKESLSEMMRKRLAEMAEANLQLDELLKMECLNHDEEEPASFKPARERFVCKIGIAKDEAFHFYYQDNFDLLEQAGAQLVFFSPLRDKQIPDVDGLYFGGGYPEVHAEVLAENLPMLQSIRWFAEEGGPVYGECGGLMYLSKGIETAEGKFFPMAGLLPGQIKMGKKLKALGYRQMISLKDNLLFRAGEKARGHEYHYSEWLEAFPDKDLVAWQAAYQVKLPALPVRNAGLGGIGGREAPHGPLNINKSRGGENENFKEEGFFSGSVLASYVHLHFASNPSAACRWVSACEAYSKRMKR
ncbi:MAG: cobyrinate a,c-diamide synthase [Nitrospirae bacterium]|nr:cobyrinate a,c-diamide synthase [Nitrospirota bacterium]